VKRLLSFAIGIWLFSSSAVPVESQTSAQQLPNIILWGRTTLGQVVSSQRDPQITYDYEFEGEWLENIDGGVKLTRQVTPTLLGRLNLGFTVNASRVRQDKNISVELTSKMFSAALLDAALQYTQSGLFGSGDNLTVELGYFPFKYNPQSTNLGEYLFRSGAYPGVIVSGFENSNIDKPKISGIRGAWGIAPWVAIDAILNTELDIYPLRDINATAIVTSALPKIVNFAFGVQFAHLIVMDSNKTTPGLDKKYHPSVDEWVGYVRPSKTDSTKNDTTLYTFKGTKLMGRATFDIKGMIEGIVGELSFLGKEDLKLYGEAAVLGVKNYPGWYNKRNERMPAMAGFNLPAFNLLDVLSIEVEHYGSPYWNSQENIWKSASPVPFTGNNAGMRYNAWADSLAKTDDDFKWSVYASKKLNTWLRISGQVACDHTPRNWYTAAPPSFVKYTEMVPRSEDWYFMLRTMIYF
jgi:hypothetical protein